MKCRIYIWIFAVCQSTPLGVSRIQRQNRDLIIRLLMSFQPLMLMAQNTGRCEAVDKGKELRAVFVTSVKPSTEYGTRVHFLSYVL